MKTFHFEAKPNTAKSLFIELSLPAEVTSVRLWAIWDDGTSEQEVPGAITTWDTNGVSILIPKEYVVPTDYPADFRLEVTDDGQELEWYDVAVGRGTIPKPVASGITTIDYVDKKHYFTAVSPIGTMAYEISYQTDPIMFEQLSTSLEFRWLGESGLYRIESSFNFEGWASTDPDWRVDIEFPNSEDYYDSDYIKYAFPVDASYSETRNQIMPLQQGQRFNIYGTGVPVTNPTYGMTVTVGARRLMY